MPFEAPWKKDWQEVEKKRARGGYERHTSQDVGEHTSRVGSLGERVCNTFLCLCDIKRVAKVWVTQAAAEAKCAQVVREVQPHLPHERLWGAAGGRGEMRGWPAKEICINIFLFFPETLFTVLHSFPLTCALTSAYSPHGELCRLDACRDFERIRISFRRGMHFFLFLLAVPLQVPER